jgi:signal transduction histidine kinase/ActR/RegA family two-component response regulator
MEHIENISSTTHVKSVGIGRMGASNLARPFMWTVIAAGLSVFIYSAYNLRTELLGVQFLILTFITVLIGIHLNIEIPRIGGKISVSDTFIFLALLLFDGYAATLLTTIESFFSTARFNKRAITIIYNCSVMAFSTFCTFMVMRWSFGDIVKLPVGGFTATYIIALCVMALVQYVVNSSLVAVAAALKNDQPIWYTWSHYYLWTSITYFAGASAAGIVAKLVYGAGFYATLITAPIIAIIYFTYHMYLKNVEASVSQAEQAERHVEELSRYIAEQERIREQFSQIEKLSALGELASGVAHNFNNTLAGILGRAQLLMRTDDQEKIRSGLQIIIKTAEDGAKIVKRIQDFAQQRKNHDFSPVAVDQLLLDVAEITRPRWKDSSEAANIHINLELDNSSNGLVMGDASELREVLVNIVFNAVDAMPYGGTLSLSSRCVDGKIEIEVSDTGIGMTPEIRSRIFDPFFTTKGKGGLGLGLAVSYGIIRRHEGTIEVDSGIGLGSTFVIRMPVAKETELLSGSEAEEERFPARAELTALRILVVDDEPAVRDLLRDVFECEGYKVVAASGGYEALSYMESRTFDLIFTDIGMPGMSGWELVRAIRRKKQQIPIVVITGWGELVDGKEQTSAEVNWVLTKPFSIEKILELAKEVANNKKGAARGVYQPSTAPSEKLHRRANA